jgi:hypothetical protein
MFPEPIAEIQGVHQEIKCPDEPEKFLRVVVSYLRLQ